MTKHLTLLLLIGFALGQLKVKSRYDLEPFTIDVNQNGSSIDKATIYGYYNCENKDCSILITYEIENEELTEAAKSLENDIASGESDSVMQSIMKLADVIESGGGLLSSLKLLSDENKSLYFGNIDDLISALEIVNDSSFSKKAQNIRNANNSLLESADMFYQPGTDAHCR